MWLIMLAGVLVVFAILGGTLLGGVYTIVLVPLAVIGVLGALISALWGRSAQVSADAGDTPSPTEHGLPHRLRQGTGQVPTSPEALVDARRQQQ